MQNITATLHSTSLATRKSFTVRLTYIYKNLKYGMHIYSKSEPFSFFISTKETFTHSVFFRKISGTACRFLGASERSKQHPWRKCCQNSVELMLCLCFIVKFSGLQIPENFRGFITALFEHSFFLTMYLSILNCLSFFFLHFFLFPVFYLFFLPVCFLIRPIFLITQFLQYRHVFFISCFHHFVSVFCTE